MTKESNSTHWHKRYVPGTDMVWKGRKDASNKSYIHQIVEKINLQSELTPCNKHGIAIIGFPCDEGVRRNLGRPGAAKGPKSLRECLGKLPYTNKQTVCISDFGDITCTDGRLDDAQKSLGEVVSMAIKSDKHPIIFGGGHEVALGTHQGIVSAYPDEEVTIINFDAHYDLRPLLQGGRGSSGTSFSQIAEYRKARELNFRYACVGVQKYGNTQTLFEVAEGLNVETIFADDLYLQDNDSVRNSLQAIIDSSSRIHLSICLDVFSESVAPGVSAPQPLGIMAWQVIPLIRMIAESKKCVCLEIAELSPLYDVNMKTAKLAAALVCDYIHHI